MAAVQPRTLQDIQDTIEVLVNNDSDTPATTDDEWTIRLNLINLAIQNWEDEDTLWDELWTTYTHGSPITAATTYTLTFTDFIKPGSTLRFVLNNATIYVPIVSPEEAQNYIGSNMSVAYITGNDNAGWTLNLSWTPTSGDGTYGATIKLDYYHHALKLSGTTDKAEMRSTAYIVYWVSAQKSLLESQSNKYSVFNARAMQAFETMKINNALPPANQSDRVDDLDVINAGGIIGQ